MAAGLRAGMGLGVDEGAMFEDHVLLDEDGLALPGSQLDAEAVALRDLQRRGHDQAARQDDLVVFEIAVSPRSDLDGTRVDDLCARLQHEAVAVADAVPGAGRADGKRAAADIPARGAHRPAGDENQVARGAEGLALPVHGADLDRAA